MRVQGVGCLVGSRMSEEFGVNIGLRQGSALSPLLFIMVMEVISRKVSTKNVLKKLIYADDLAIVTDSKQELQEVLLEWKNLFEGHGLRMSLDKTEVLSVGRQRQELGITLAGRGIKQRDSFAYLGGMIAGDGRSDGEVRKRVQSGALAWSKVEGVMSDRHISKKLKGKVLGTCVIPACIYGLETMALFGAQQQRLQVCENNWMRRIAGVKRVDRRRLEDIREEIWMDRSITERVIRGRMR